MTDTRLSPIIVALLMACVYPAIPHAQGELLQHVTFTEQKRTEAAVPEANRLVFALPFADTAPEVHGRLDDAVWERDDAFLGKFRLGLSETPARHYRRAWAAYDADNLYIGVRLEREPGTELRVNTREPDNSAIWKDDEVEIFIDPFNSGSRYVQMILNSEAVLYDARHHYVEVPDAPAASPGATVLERVTDSEWDSHLTRAVQIEDEWWSLEMALPMASLGLEGAPAGHRLGFNITSADWDTEEYTTLSPNDDWHDPLQFGTIVLGEPRVEVTELDLTGVGSGRNLLRAEVRHIEGPTGTCTMALTFHAPNQDLHKKTRFELTEGETARPAMAFTVNAEAGKWNADVEISGPDGALIYATRRSGVLPGAMRVNLRSSAVLSDGPPIEMNARLGVGRLTARRLELMARLTTADGGIVTTQNLGRVRGPIVNALLPVAGLPAGTYSLELAATRNGDLVARGSDALRIVRSPFESEASN